ncbi:MAG: T9SS type A sorting domain-containing protein [Bacteroidota bacterium]
MLRWILVAPLALVSALASSQPYPSDPTERNVEALTTTVSTDKPSYAEGEVIEIRVTIANPTDSSAVKRYGHGCITQFSLNGLSTEEYTACTLAVRPIEFPPYSSLTVVWHVDPLDMGWPTHGGTHTVIGSSVGEPDTTTFDAPAAMGGRVTFRTVQGLTPADLASLRDSLSAEVLSEWESDGRVQGDWRVRGAALDTIVVRYQADSRFDHFEAIRWIVPTEEVFTAADATPLNSSLQVLAFPNPVSETLELTISASQPEEATLEVFDALGRRIYLDTSWRGTTRQLDVSQWPPGLYTVRVSTRDASATQRVMVIR